MLDASPPPPFLWFYRIRYYYYYAEIGMKFGTHIRIVYQLFGVLGGTY